MDKVARLGLGSGVYLTAVQSERFKTGCLSVTLLTEHTKKTAALNAVLPYVLRRGTAGLPDMEAIAGRLDSLYGARIEPTLRKRGETAALGFFADFPDGDFLPGRPDLLSPTAQLLGEVLLSPATSGGRLRADYVESERDKLIEDIEAEINDKRSYAGQRLVETMFRGERYGVPKLGTAADARKISVQTLTRHYKSLIASARVEAFYCGAARPDQVARILREALADLPRGGVREMPATLVPETGDIKPRTIVERMDVTQSRLVMGFRLRGLDRARDTAAMLVFNAAFGGSAASRLFLDLRERLALCYHVSSSLDRHKRALFVSAGIDCGDFKRAREEIMKELGSIADGGLEEWELDSARRAVVSSIYSALDEPTGLEGMYLDRAVLDESLHPGELAALASTVSAEAVRDVARAAVLSHTYLLASEENDAEKV